MMRTLLPSAATVAAVLAVLLAHGQAVAKNPALAGYRDYAALAADIEKLAEGEHTTVRKLTTTRGGRHVHLITVGAGKAEDKPAILVVGSVHASHALGAELATRFARDLAERAAKDKSTAELLERVTYYIIPLPNPDGYAKNFLGPYREHNGNARPTDDDRDFDLGEDPPDDLDGDGWITSLRVDDPTGDYRAHPDDPRVLIKVDPKQNEPGQFRLLTEGRDNDDDRQFNEDAGDGVDFNRNFPHKYPYFKPAAGPHQVSEAESVAVADFCLNRPNIALVFSFSPEDNLMHPWKPNAGEKGRIKTSVLSADAPQLNFLAKAYRDQLKLKDPPAAAKGAGSFTEWAYFQYGRWSLAARARWAPKPETVKKKDGDKDDKKPSPEKRGAADLNALNWLAKEKIDGFADWKEIKHPDFPDQKVEVGGFRSHYRLNPPARLLAELAEKHAAYLRDLPRHFARLEIDRARVESLGEGVFRLTTRVVNRGYLSTEAEMGRITRQAYPLQIQLTLPKSARLLEGAPRRLIGRLKGNGGNAEQTWLIYVQDAAAATIEVHAWAPAVGKARRTVRLAPGD